ncbi:hypothetical protein AB0J80_07515 [Actinoplanes sp. NPDC049548]|uniref:hypothetical protein n=1 Tax=Actinoplanes sp. NPDC049548 TaxID=3155152 RepID=UPI00342F89DE
MEPTANPEDGRQSRGPGRFWPASGADRAADDQADTADESGSDDEANGERAAADQAEGAPTSYAAARPHPALTDDTKLVALGSRRPADALLGGTTNGLRWTNQGGFPPVETNGHRNGETGPRHGGAPQNGQSPLINGGLPHSLSPFGPPPETPPLYAPSPFATAGNPPVPEQPIDPLTPPQAGPELPGDAFPGGRPVSGQPAASGSAQVPLPPSTRPSGARPVSGAPGADRPAQAAESEPPAHDAWAPPAHRGATAGSASIPGANAPLEPFPGGNAFALGQSPPGADPARAGELGWGRDGNPATAFRTDPLDPAPASPGGGRRSRAEERSPHLDEARAAGEEETPGGRRAARQTGEVASAQPLRPGDLDHSPISFWDEAGAERLRTEWHEVKAQFVDDPVAALTRAHDLLTEAVQELTESMLAERDQLDPLRGTDTPDTESMRMAMRGYREFLDRILGL